MHIRQNAISFTRHGFILLVCMLGAGNVGCGDEGITLERAEKTLTEKLCELAVTCGEFADVDTCVASDGASLTLALPDAYSLSDSCSEASSLQDCLRGRNSALGQILANAKSGRIEYDGSALETCIDSVLDPTFGLAPLDRGVCYAFKGFNEFNSACIRALEGTVAEDGACLDALDCDERSVCQGLEAATCSAGRCTSLAAIGQSCVSSPCGKGALCGANDVCVAAGQVNDCGGADALDCVTSCERTYDCIAGVCLAGTCVIPPRTGEACSVDSGPHACGDRTDYCDAILGTCVARLAVGVNCPAQAANPCVAYATCEVGSCVARPSVGQSCDGSLSPCLGRLECVDGRCALPQALAICPVN